jgi:tripeptide aminopeptidase
MSGSAAEMSIDIILRDFERDLLTSQGELLHKVCAAVQAGEPRAQITCTITPQYRNMRYWLEDDMRPVELAREACRQAGVEPFSLPVRGGTDGSRLTELGVPTPNVFTGMQEIHGPLEWVSLQDMAAATEVCIKVVQLWTAAGPVDSKPEHGPESPADTGAAVDWTDAI